MNKSRKKPATLYSNTRPSDAQVKKFLAFLEERHGEKFSLRWEETPLPEGSFRLEADSEVYNWSPDGHLSQLRDLLGELKKKEGDIIPLIRDALTSWTPSPISQEVGEVLTVGDSIATVSGLENATYGEILLFPSGIRAMVQDLREDEIGCILFGDESLVSAGDIVRRTGKVAGIPVGDAFLGRVVDALGSPIDGKGEIDAEEYRAIEHPAPGIIDRQSVNTPMETGILAIDSMFPIGRGQRELIIGDRQTGKTAIAVDTILNQKGKDVICIYVAIGQKASSVAQLVTTLRAHGAMDYSIVVSASASDPAPLQYIAPYSGCTLGEYFMHQGKDVLIIYDDLSKHATAYRSLSLLLERAPGREAYPGDVFYLHSRLLERSAHLSDALGGGSMTALPIVETQSGDVSAYIPTNIISITDGQIFLESDLFFAGQRPAVNVGLSVSRVGGDAQTKAMKTAAGAIRLDLAQYREMEVFTQFAGDLDDATRTQLAYGQSLMNVLRQPQHKPYKAWEQVVLLITSLNGLYRAVSLKEFEKTVRRVLSYIEEKHPDLVDRIQNDGILDTGDSGLIVESAKKAVR